MTKYGSADVGFLLVGGYSVLGHQTQLEDMIEALMEDTTVLGSAWEESDFVGVKRYTINQRGFYDTATASNNELLAVPGTSRVLCFSPEGNVLGAPCIGNGVVQVDYVRQIQRAALHKANASYMSETDHDEGIILHTHSAETADGDTEDGDSQDAGASSAAGGAGYLQVSALDLGGYDSVTFKIRDSADDVTYADLITFTNITTAQSAERATVAGTVNRHLATSWAFNGSGSDPSVTFMIGFARG